MRIQGKQINHLEKERFVWPPETMCQTKELTSLSMPALKATPMKKKVVDSNFLWSLDQFSVDVTLDVIVSVAIRVEHVALRSLQDHQSNQVWMPTTPRMPPS